jgi:phosphoribosylanthranilate isomerase
VRREVDLSAIQLQGDEPAELVRGWPVPVIRAVRLSSESEARAASRTLVADYVLVEGRVEGAFGGVGARFPWRWAEAFPAARLFVAGGLTPENVAEAVRALRPFAVDVATGVESAPGVKEPARVAAFVEHAKAA